MSFILDALNRSESERSSADSVPGIQTVHDVSENTVNSTWRRALWPALMAAMAVIAIVLWQGEGETEALPTGTVDNLAAAGEGSEPAPASFKAAAKADLQSSAPVSGTDTAAAQEVPKPESVSRAQFIAEAAADPDVAALYRTSEASAPAGAQASDISRQQPPARETAQAGGPRAVEQPRLDVNTLAEAANEALAERRTADEPVIEHEAPFIVDLRQTVKDQIPSIFYSAHNWATNPAQRSVVLNGEVRRVGQQIKPGLKLVEILEGSIVLDFKGTEFQLRSLNSWVNL